MSQAEFRFRCPHCKREVKEVGVRKEEASNPKRVTCPHCNREFELEKALQASGESLVEQSAKDLQREFDKLNRKLGK